MQKLDISVLNCIHFDNSKHLKLKTPKGWFSAQNPIMCAIFGPKSGDFQKMLRNVWNGEKCNKIKIRFNFFSVLNILVYRILGIGKINNTILLRTLAEIGATLN